MEGEKFLQAAEAGNLEYIRGALRDRASRKLVNYYGKNDRTALHIAVMHSHFDIVTTLLMEKASIDCKDDQGETPLHKSVWDHSSDAIVQSLILHRADVHAGTHGQMNIMHYVAWSPRYEKEEERIRRTRLIWAAEPQAMLCLFMTDNDGRDPALIAFKKRQSNTCNFFITQQELFAESVVPLIKPHLIDPLISVVIQYMVFHPGLRSDALSDLILRG